MNVENTYDEVLFAAVQAGLEPDQADLDQIRVPAGDDPEEFRLELRRTVQQVITLRSQGNHGEARSIAAQAQNLYLAKFEALMPIRAGGTPEDTAAVGRRMFGRDDDELADLGKRMFGR